MRPQKAIAAVLTFFTFGFGVSQAIAEDIAANLNVLNEYTIIGDKNFLTDFTPFNTDGSINVVVEIPTGTIAKWEVTKPDGVLKWEFKNGKPRKVNYLGYPGNYGMIPRTLIAKDDGGDGDALDVIVLGEAMPRGTVVKARVIGVLKLLVACTDQKSPIWDSVFGSVMRVWRMRSGISFTISSRDRRRLQAIVRDPKSLQKHVWRARIVLLSGDGLGTSAIMSETGKSKTCVWRWQERFMHEGVEGLLYDKTRPPGIAPISPDRVAEIVRLTLEPPPFEVTHWTLRAMAKVAGVAASTVQAIWKAHGLSPHRWRQFKLSNDPAFAEKLANIVGLYVDPPAHAVVLSVDEKSQIQALDRTQPGLPMKKGRAGTMTHDYKRHGTTTLFAALNVLDGTVIGQNMQRHRHQEFIRFLNRIEREVPADKAIHVILDNYAAHKKDKVRAWLDRHPRWTFHFTPTSCSWLNAVEGFFAKLTRRRLKHGVFHSVVDLQAAINRFIQEYNADNPKPFVWKADPNDIIAARNRGFQTLESIH